MRGNAHKETLPNHGLCGEVTGNGNEMKSGLTAILYNEPLTEGMDGWEASRDVLVQVDAVRNALESLGIPSVDVPFASDPGRMIDDLRASGACRVFNLCETVGEDATLAGHPAAVLELLGLPFSGSGSFSLMLSTDKAASKILMRGAGIKTPEFLLYDGPESVKDVSLQYPVIAKPRFEDASIGIDQESVFRSRRELIEGSRRLFERYGPLIIERFIGGREFNVSVLGYPSLRLLAVAEIDFSSFPAELFPIVGYRAKWEENTPEYLGTSRIFPDNLSKSLATSLQRAAISCARLFQVRDYGRVDMRVDHLLQPWVLEVNANPCISPDAGFAAAASHYGISYRELVRLLVSYMDARRQLSLGSTARPVSGLVSAA